MELVEKGVGIYLSNLQTLLAEGLLPSGGSFKLKDDTAEVAKMIKLMFNYVK